MRVSTGLFGVIASVLIGFAAHAEPAVRATLVLRDQTIFSHGTFPNVRSGVVDGDIHHGVQKEIRVKLGFQRKKWPTMRPTWKIEIQVTQSEIENLRDVLANPSLQPDEIRTVTFTLSEGAQAFLRKYTVGANFLFGGLYASVHLYDSTWKLAINDIQGHGFNAIEDVVVNKQSVLDPKSTTWTNAFPAKTCEGLFAAN